MEATGSHSSLRIQLYPMPGSPTTEVDDVNVNVSLAANGGFEDGGGPWRPYPGTKSNYVVYANAPGAPPPTPARTSRPPTARRAAAG